MSNPDHTPSHTFTFENDRKQAWLTLWLTGFASVVIVAMILAVV